MTTNSNADANADAWGLPGVLDFFVSERSTTNHLYPSEWFFLKDKLTEGVSILDIGCAQGGFASIAREQLTDFSYTGIDINADMISLAQEKHTQAIFHHIAGGDFSVLKEQKFDLVLALGILHLEEAWRETLAAAWAHTAGALIFDLREIALPSIEDKMRSYFRMDFNDGDAAHRETTLPYNLINAGDAQKIVVCLGADAAAISHYGYVHAVSDSACCPVESVMANTWCLER